MPKTGRAPGFAARRPTQQLTNSTLIVWRSTEIPRVVAQFIAPAGGRRQWWCRVDCPACWAEHLHTDPRRPGLHGWLRGCPTTGTAYRIVLGWEVGRVA